MKIASLLQELFLFNNLILCSATATHTHTQNVLYFKMNDPLFLFWFYLYPIHKRNKEKKNLE